MGGSCFWLTGPEDFDSTPLSDRSSERGVLVDKGETYYLTMTIAVVYGSDLPTCDSQATLSVS